MAMPKRKALFIDTGNRNWRIEEVEDERILGVVDFAVEMHLNRYESWRHHPINPKNALIFGVGPLAASNIPGTHRLIFCARSPIWKGFFTSTMGGAGYVFCGLNVNFCSIEGESSTLLILRISNINGKLNVEFFEMDNDQLLAIYGGYRGKRGLYALQQYVIDNYGDVFADNNIPFRVLAVGPAALNTSYGAICSTVIRDGKMLDGINEFAGRGGLGSVMAQAHGVVAVIYGGNDCHKHEKLSDQQFVERIFEEEFGKRMIEVIMEKGKKYHYDPAVGSGGTYGVNFSTLGSWMLFLNWTSVYWSEEKRREVYEKLIKNHYLKQFNEEIIKPRKFMNCGEPCPLVCKKYSDYKRDYEPYEANGPNSGIVDMKAADTVVEKVDELGFDAIQAGTIVSWIMELMHRNMLKPEDFDLKKKPVFDIDRLDVKASFHNAEIAVKLVEKIAHGEDLGKIFAQGIRAAAEDLESMFHHPAHEGEFKDFAVYTPYGEDGEIAPCQYWVPGFFIPLPIQGKFLTYYHAEWLEPYELGRKSGERTIKELYSTNNGLCRFHRGWSEKTIERMVNEAFETNINFYEHHRRLAARIWLYDERCGLKPTFWDSERVVDVIWKHIEKLYEGDKQNKELEKWVEMFRKDKWLAAKHYWLRVLDGIHDAIGMEREVKI